MTTSWIDFSPYAMKLFIGVIDPPMPPLPARILVMTGDTDSHEAELEKIGFMKEPSSGRWVSFDQPVFSDFLSAFPMAEIIPDVDMRQFARRMPMPAPAAAAEPAVSVVPTPSPSVAEPELAAPEVNAEPPVAPAPENGPTEVVSGGDTANEVEIPAEIAAEDVAAPPEVTEPTPEVAAPARQAEPVSRAPEAAPLSQQEIERLIANATFIGLNRLQNKVMRGPTGRFLVSTGKNSSLKITFESAQSSVQPGLFLRGTNPVQMDVAADGFVEELVGGAINRIGDLKRFTAAINSLDDIADDDERLFEAHELIEAAIDRWLLRNGSRTGKSMADIFQLASRFHGSRAYLGDLSRLFKDRQFPVTAPIGIVIQRALGIDAEYKDKKLVVSGGHGLAHFLLQNTNVKVFADNERHAGIASRTLAIGGAKDDIVTSERPVYAGADAVVINAMPSLLPEPVTYDGNFTVRRADIAEFIDSLADREPLGRSIFIMQAESSGGFNQEEEAARAWIGARFAIEGCTDIDGSLHLKRPDAPPMRVLVVGRARPAILDAAPEPAMRKTEVSTLAALWTWSSGLIYARAKIAEYHAELEAGPAVAAPDGTEENRDENYFQSPYVSASGIGHSSTMVPRNLDGATRHALSRVSHIYGDIDNKVQTELGMTREQMEAAFSPEQVDAISLYLYAAERNRGFLLADQTGIGKGRTLAAIMRRAVLNGQKVLFLTEKEINISDIWRDIRHIGAENEFSPLIINDNAEIVDEMNGRTVMRSPKRDYTLQKMISNQWPDEHNLIIATYSQFNRPGVPRRGRRRAAQRAAAEAARLAEAANNAENGVQNHEDRERSELREALHMHEAAGTSAKSVWIRHAIDENVVVILDESHNATSDSNISKNIATAITTCGGVVFSSATFAKKAKNMDIYKPLLPEFVSMTNLGDILRKGGESMQETLSSMLVKDGIMIRREHDLSKCEFMAVVDKDNEHKNRMQMDALAPVLAEMAYLSGDLDEIVGARNDVIMRQAMREIEDEQHAERHAKSLQLSRMSIGSPLYHLSRLFVCSLLIDRASQEAIKALKNNQKPVILVENTVQSVLQEMFDAGDDAPVEPDFKSLLHRVLGQLCCASMRSRTGRVSVNLADETPMEKAIISILDESINHIATYVNTPLENVDQEELRAALKSAMGAARDVVSEKNHHEAEVLQNAHGFIVNRLEVELEQKLALEAVVENPMSLRPETPAVAVKRIKTMIDAMPSMPASAIDAVRERIVAESRRLMENGEIDGLWTVEEITGRTLEFRDGKVSRRTSSRKVDIKNRFNSGETDALIISTSGTTGIDLHAGRRFNDKRQRVLIELQAPADISKQIQAYGRVNRFDQVCGPIIISLMAGLPIELRLLAMRNAKLSRLSANTTSNREHSAKINDIPDMMNEVGDIVAARYAESRPDLIRRLGFKLDRNLDIAERNAANQILYDEDTGDASRSANELLSRIAMLPVAEQVQVFNELQAEYESAIQELDAKGINPLKSHVMEGVVHLRQRVVFDGADNINPTSEFHRPVYAQNVVVERTIAPLKSDFVASEYERGLVAMGADGVSEYADKLERNRERMLQTYLPASIGLDEALESGSPRVVTLMNNRILKLIDVLRGIRCGSGVKFTIDGIVESGIITRIVPPDPRYMHLASSYSARIAVPGWTAIQSLSLQALISDENFSVDDGLNGDNADEILSSFDSIADRTRLDPRVILTGNEWMAMNLSIQHKLGSMVAWQDEQGIRHRGVLVSKRNVALDMIPVSLRNSAMVLAAIFGQNGFHRPIAVFGNSDLHPSGIIMKQVPGHLEVIADLPLRNSRKYGYIFTTDVARIIAETQDPALVDRTRLRIDENRCEELINALMEAGVRFFVSHVNRAAANNWMAENMANEDVIEAEIRAPAAQPDAQPGLG